MSPKNLNVIKIPKILKEKLSNKKVLQLYNNFEKSFSIQEDFIVAVSGGPDSLALVALTKFYNYYKKTKFYYVLVDHGIRNNSFEEAEKVKELLKKNGILLMHVPQ